MPAAARNTEEGVRLPLPLIVGIALFVITSIPASIWMAASVNTRLGVAEQKIERVETNYQKVPERLSALESKTDTIYLLLQDMRKDMRNGNK